MIHGPEPLRICLIVDSDCISKWEHDAIVYAASRVDIKIDSVLFCTNHFLYRNYFKHFLYFVLNILAMRNKWTKQTGWGHLISDKSRIRRFSSENDGNWQSIPNSTTATQNSLEVDLPDSMKSSLMRQKLV